MGMSRTPRTLKDPRIIGEYRLKKKGESSYKRTAGKKIHESSSFTLEGTYSSRADDTFKTTLNLFQQAYYNLHCVKYG